jgi:hypothetical protein
MSEYKTVTVTKLISEPKQAGKVMKCQASIDGSAPIELVFFPDKGAGIVEGASIRAEYKPASGNYPESWFSVGVAQARSGGFGGKGGFGGGRPPENPAEKRAGVSMSYAVSLVNGGAADMSKLYTLADDIYEWMTNKVK